MPGFCASIALAFILGVELFYYVVVRGICDSLAEVEEKSNGGYASRWQGGSNPQDTMFGLNF